MSIPEPAGADLEALGAATRRLLATLDGIDDTAVTGPSLLPGWTRAHVLTHLARNADGIRNLILSARTGAPFGMYPGRPLRDADIDAGASRPPELVVLDVRAACERLAVDLAAMPGEAWIATIRPFAPRTDGPELPAAALPGLRLREVEAHHVDLDLGYGFDRTPAPLLRSFLDQLPGRFAGSALDPATVRATDLDLDVTIGTGGGPVIEGRGADVLLWALGRSPGAGLTASTGDVPASPGWG